MGTQQHRISLIANSEQWSLDPISMSGSSFAARLKQSTAEHLRDNDLCGGLSRKMEVNTNRIAES
jgi:hypothetical protein